MPSFFSRKSSRSARSGEVRPPSSASTPGAPFEHATASTSSISRAASVYSFRSERSTSQSTQRVEASELLASFSSKSRIPSSRRLSTLSRTPAPEVDIQPSRPRDHRSATSPLIPSTDATSTRNDGSPKQTVGLTSDFASSSQIKSGVGVMGLNNVISLPKMSTLNGHGNVPLILVESSDGEDQAFESPDEFEDDSIPEGEAVNVPKTLDEPSSVAATAAIDYSIPDPNETPLRADIRQIWYAVSLFLNSRMKDAEIICYRHREDRLYYALGHCLLESLKALMTFEPNDIKDAIDGCKLCLDLATKEKHKTGPGARSASWSERLTGSLGGVVRGSSLTPDTVERLTVEQRHAELAYAECLLLKAVLGIIYSGDFLAFLKEALNMRSAHATYKALSSFISQRDARHPQGRDDSIDLDFRSGVEFGSGSVSLILSLLPSSVIKVMSIFGFSGDRQEALKTLMGTGGWTSSSSEPSIREGPGNEGIRRCICDMTLLMYHLVIASFFPVSDVDIKLADNILHYNLKRYPKGVFFLYFSGRLYATQSIADQAVKQYHKAIASQMEYRQIQHICYWDLACSHLALAEYSRAHECLTILDKESKWSKALYCYAKAVTSYEDLLARGVQNELIEEGMRKQKLEDITLNMESVPGYLQRIAGKSLPIEKFVARKSKRFLARSILWNVHLRQINTALSELELCEGQTKLPEGWWDDMCLCHFLRAVVVLLIGRPEPYVKPDINPPLTLAEADQLAITSYEYIISNSTNIELEHHLAYFAHYEYGRLLLRMGSEHLGKAREHLNIVLDGKVSLGPTKGKGKVSMQNMAVIRANSAMELLKAAETSRHRKGLI